MAIEKHGKLGVNKWGLRETLFVAWVGIALAVLIPATIFLGGSFPLFTVVWLVVPLLAVLRSRDARRAGFQSLARRKLLGTASLNLAALLLISALVEPWSHAYQGLVQAAISSPQPDTTFAWLVRFDGLAKWGGLLLYSGCVTIFAEELFFRGWLLQLLQPKMGMGCAILIQAVLFTIPQLLAALLLSPVQGAVYAMAYSWLGVGMVGGWAAWRTQTIWPSVIAAALWNAILIAWVM
jgi:membrane protease YdiL (CAAX protease family)